MMECMKAEVDPMDGYMNDPRIKLYVDDFPDRVNMEYELHELGDSKSFLIAEEAGYVDYFLHDPRRETGYAGSIFTVNVKGVGERSFRGPWSSRASVVEQITGLPVIDLSLATVEYPRSAYARATTVQYCKEALERHLPEWEVLKVKALHSNDTYWVASHVLDGPKNDNGIIASVG